MESLEQGLVAEQLLHNVWRNNIQKVKVITRCRFGLSGAVNRASQTITYTIRLEGYGRSDFSCLKGAIAKA